MFLFLFGYNLVGPEYVRAVRGVEPQNQLTDGTLLYVLHLVLEGFLMVGVGVSSF